MIIPIRCYTCNQTIANKWKQYVEITSEKPDEKATKTKQLEAFEKLNIKRDCCRRHFLAHVELIDKI